MSAKPAADDTPVTSPTIAQPDRTFVLNQSMEPVRVWQDNAWKDLHPTPHFNNDGSASPNVTAAEVRPSGRKAGPFATSASNGRGLTMAWPPLPKPTLNAPTATRNNVVTSVDLPLAVEDDGPVNNAIAIKKHDSSNPWPQALKFALGLSSGTSILKNSDGSLDADADADADPVYTTDAPLIRDTARAPNDASAPTGGQLQGQRPRRPVGWHLRRQTQDTQDQVRHRRPRHPRAEIITSDCNHSKNQQGALASARQIWNVDTSLPLSNPGNSTANSTQLHVDSCATNPSRHSP